MPKAKSKIVKYHCWNCRKMKPHVRLLTIEPKAHGPAQICNTCADATLQCDICFNLTSYGEGAINYDVDDAGEFGDGIICSDCQKKIAKPAPAVAPVEQEEPTPAPAPLESVPAVTDAWTCGLCGETFPKADAAGIAEHFKGHFNA
jgi:hypothetical protein